MRAALAGLAAPVWFTALVIAQGLLQPDYSQVSLPISALAAWPHGWMQNVTFSVYGALLAIYAAGLHRSIRPVPWGAAGPALIAVAAAGAIVAGIFPLRRTGGALVEPPGHVAGSLMHFLGAGLGLIVASRRMALDARWHDVSTYALASGLVLLASFVAFAFLALPADAPLHPWAGLAQRLIVAVWLASVLVLAGRLLRLARESSRESASGRRQPDACRP